MNELITVVQKLGLGAGILIIGAYVLIKHVIPHWKERAAAEQTFRHEQTRAIMRLQETSLKEMTDAIRTGVEADRALARHMEALTGEVRRVASNRERNPDT